jgi:hypothetical protein
MADKAGARVCRLGKVELMGLEGRQEGYQGFKAAKGDPGVLKQDVSSAWIC